MVDQAALAVDNKVNPRFETFNKIFSKGYVQETSSLLQKFLTHVLRVMPSIIGVLLTFEQYFTF